MREIVSLLSVRTMSFAAATIYVSVCAVQDLRRRRISLRWSACMGALALAAEIAKAAAFMKTAENILPGMFFFNCLNWLAGLAPGCLLLLLAAAAEGSSGSGDGICFLIIGAFTDARTAWGLMAASLCLASVSGIVLMCLKKADKKTRLPFLTISGAVWTVALLNHLSQVKWQGT